jgi:hypothetical protein
MAMKGCPLCTLHGEQCPEHGPGGAYSWPQLDEQDASTDFPEEWPYDPGYPGSKERRALDGDDALMMLLDRMAVTIEIEHRQREPL